MGETMNGDVEAMVDATMDKAKEMVDIAPEAEEAANKCMKQFKWNLGMGNSTKAGAEMINCVSIEGARLLEEEEEEAPSAANANTRSVLSAAFLVVAAASV